MKTTFVYMFDLIKSKNKPNNFNCASVYLKNAKLQ